METAHTINYTSDGNMTTLCFDCIYLREPLKCIKKNKELDRDNMPKFCINWTENW